MLKNRVMSKAIRFVCDTFVFIFKKDTFSEDLLGWTLLKKFSQTVSV